METKKYLGRISLSRIFTNIKNYIDDYVSQRFSTSNFATKTELSDLMATVETNEPYLPLSGGTLTGNLYMTGNSAITVGDETSTSYGGIQSVRACSGDDDNVNTAGYFINVDGSSKFLHRRGAYNEKEDAYLLFDGRGYRFFAGGEKGTYVTTTGGSSGEDAIPVFTAIVNDERPTFNGKGLAFQEDIEKIISALNKAGISIN